MNTANVSTITIPRRIGVTRQVEMRRASDRRHGSGILFALPGTPVRAALSLTIESCAAKKGTKMHSLVFQTFAGPPFGAHGVAEHSSVMSMVPVSSYIKKCGAWLVLPTSRNAALGLRSDEK
jgi:hypothetical protein